MAIVNEDGHWIDSQGHPVPKKYVKKYDQVRDKMVQRLASQAKKVSDSIRKLREAAFSDIEQFLIDAEKMYGMNVRTAGGNKILSDFSNSIRIEVKVDRVIDFDERLQMAKAIIDELIRKWSAGSNEKILLIIDRAFQVDQKGRLDKGRILDLRTLAIQDEEWKKAMNLINESIRVVGTRRYISFSERRNDAWRSVPLDIADF